MKRKAIIIIVCILLFALINRYYKMNTDLKSVISKEEPQLLQREKIEDFEYMYTILQENYPFFEVNKRLYGIDWLKNKEKYTRLVKSSKNDEDFLEIMQKILLDLHNGHTHMVGPYDFYFFKELMKEEKMWADQFTNDKAVLRYKKWKTEEITILNEAYSASNDVRLEILEENEIAYLAIKSFIYTNIEKDMQIIEPFLKEISNYKALVIDIRGNGGGSDEYWKKHLVPLLIQMPLQQTSYCLYRGGAFAENFIKQRFGELGYKALLEVRYIHNEELKNLPSEVSKNFEYYQKNRVSIYPENSNEFKGKIYLLVDQEVFSASESFAIFAKDTGFATLVGQTTGGDGIGIDPLFCTLPNSGYIFRFSANMGLTADGTCNEEFKTKPDIQIIAGKNENLNEDEIIQYILKQNNERFCENVNFQITIDGK